MGDEGRLRERSRLVDGHSPACLNCGAALTGPFCAECGQRDIPPYPNVRELAVDAVAEFSGWDGRLASTLRALIERPGLLTHEFLEGRRVRYVSPLRLYLSASLVYFLVAAAAPNPVVRSGNMTFGGISFGVTKSKSGSGGVAARRVADATSKSIDSAQGLTPAEREAALKDWYRSDLCCRGGHRTGAHDLLGLHRRIVAATGTATIAAPAT
jgi:hypothetical protein